MDYKSLLEQLLVTKLSCSNREEEIKTMLGTRMMLVFAWNLVVESLSFNDYELTMTHMRMNLRKILNMIIEHCKCVSVSSLSEREVSILLHPIINQIRADNYRSEIDVFSLNSKRHWINGLLLGCTLSEQGVWTVPEYSEENFHYKLEEATQFLNYAVCITNRSLKEMQRASDEA